MVDLHRRQQEWIEERENLIYKMENHQQMLVKENENDIKKRKEREQEIVEQVYLLSHYSLNSACKHRFYLLRNEPEHGVVFCMKRQCSRRNL